MQRYPKIDERETEAEIERRNEGGRKRENARVREKEMGVGWGLEWERNSLFTAYLFEI